MIRESGKPTNVAEMMNSVKAAWDKAPSGPRKDAALKHYLAAEQAQIARDDRDTIKELEAATYILA